MPVEWILGALAEKVPWSELVAKAGKLLTNIAGKLGSNPPSPGAPGTSAPVSSGAVDSDQNAAIKDLAEQQRAFAQNLESLTAGIDKRIDELVKMARLLDQRMESMAQRHSSERKAQGEIISRMEARMRLALLCGVFGLALGGAAIVVALLR